LDDYKNMTNDPCPVGWQVPTHAQWAGALSNNTITQTEGVWSISEPNYENGMHVGTGLFLPAAGYRSADAGTWWGRGAEGNYWASTQIATSAYSMGFVSNSQNAHHARTMTGGFSVRCISQ
jgi:uncharacterized protein (TIGR02145 family)